MQTNRSRCLTALFQPGETTVAKKKEGDDSFSGGALIATNEKQKRFQEENKLKVGCDSHAVFFLCHSLDSPMELHWRARAGALGAAETAAVDCMQTRSPCPVIPP